MQVCQAWQSSYGIKSHVWTRKALKAPINAYYQQVFCLANQRTASQSAQCKWRVARDLSLIKPKKSPADLPPIPASTASRSKLKAYHFQELPQHGNLNDFHSAIVDDDHEFNEENETFMDIQSAMAASQLMPGPAALSQHSQHKECPQTPAGRLPLAELIAAVDDNANQNLELTPVERVLWHHVPGSSQFSSSEPASISKHNRKRARSSSPASSQNETSNHFLGKKQSFDLQTLQKTLKTPQADPAGDLWTRYALKTGAKRDGSPKGHEINFAELLRSSSPQTPDSHLKARGIGGLRRSISCANEWPTSAAKRRRLNHGGSQNQALNEHHAVDNPENPKMSRVSLLVEQVQNALLRSGAETLKAQKSHNSSPSRGNDAEPELLLPSSARDENQDLSESGRSSSVEKGESETAEGDWPRGPDKTSEFGDDDFNDDELLEVVHASLAPETSLDSHTTKALASSPPRQIRAETLIPRTEPPTRVKTKSEPVTTRDGNRRSETSLIKSEAQESSKRIQVLHDEFDDDDDDNNMSALDIEGLISAYDQQPQILPRQGQQVLIPQETTRKPLAELVQNSKSAARTQPRKAPKASKIIEVSSDEEFGEEADFDEFVAQCTAASQPAVQDMSVRGRYSGSLPERIIAKYRKKRQRCVIQRYQIIKVVEGEYKTDCGSSRPEKVLLVQPEKLKTTKVITLRQSWVRSPCHPGSYVHLVGNFDNAGQCVVDDKQNMIILHPDHLVSATVVGDSFSCTRRAVLQDRIKSTNDSSEAQVYGHILHEIFQEAMKANRWDDDWLHTTIENIVSHYLESLFEINVDPIKAVHQLKSKTAALQSWAEIFVSTKPKPEAVIKDRNGAISTLSVNKLLEVEEKVWSPMYGLKGNVDATIQITTSDGSGEKVLTVPFELKTGRHANMAHKAQTALYTLLLSDRYGSYPATQIEVKGDSLTKCWQILM
ncbi:MAG: hypothetical protein Q9219_000458 [cf. Caloplaca sp. 3 TL-2023]